MHRARDAIALGVARASAPLMESAIPPWKVSPPPWKAPPPPLLAVVYGNGGSEVHWPLGPNLSFLSSKGSKLRMNEWTTILLLMFGICSVQHFQTHIMCTLCLGPATSTHQTQHKTRALVSVEATRYHMINVRATCQWVIIHTWLPSMSTRTPPRK